MLQSAVIDSDFFQDVITDLAYDYYGQKLAVGSADHKIRIFVLAEHTGDWELEEEWKAHDAPITNICWSHPSYGPLIASASFDRTVKIWEDLPARASHGRTRWVERATLPDALSAVRSLDFAPEAIGLKLAALSSDGFLRVYECLDLPGLVSWSLKEEMEVREAGTPLTGSPELPTTPTATAVAAGAGAGGMGMTYQPPGGEKAQHPALGRVEGRAQVYRTGPGEKEAEGGWSVCWCMERWWGEVLAVVAGAVGVVKIFQFPPGQRPITLCTLRAPGPPTPPPSQHPRHQPSATGSTSPQPPEPHQDDSHSSSSSNPKPPAHPFPLTSVAWAPACGRSFHLIAAGSQSGEVFLWKVFPKSPDAVQEEDSWTAELAGEFNDHERPVGRVQFNPTGTILSSAGDDGRIRLWKPSYTGVWRPMGSIYATPSEDPDERGSADDMDEEDEDDEEDD